MCPEGRDPEGPTFLPCALVASDERTGLRTRLSIRERASPDVAGPSTADGRPPGPQDPWPGLDGPGPPAGGLIHEAHRGGMAPADARERGRRDAAGHGPHRRDRG